MVERHPYKVNVIGSNPVPPTRLSAFNDVVQSLHLPVAQLDRALVLVYSCINNSIMRLW